MTSPPIQPSHPRWSPRRRCCGVGGWWGSKVTAALRPRRSMRCERPSAPPPANQIGGGTRRAAGPSAVTPRTAPPHTHPPPTPPELCLCIAHTRVWPCGARGAAERRCGVWGTAHARLCNADGRPRAVHCTLRTPTGSLPPPLVHSGAHVCVRVPHPVEQKHWYGRRGAAGAALHADGCGVGG